MKKPKLETNPNKAVVGDSPGSSSLADPHDASRNLLGEYPEQNKDIRPPEDLAGEVWRKDIDAYPLRKPEEDPRWAVRIVWVWLVMAATGIAGILALLILGAFFD